MQEEIRKEMAARGLTSAGLSAAMQQYGGNASAEAVRAWTNGRAMPNFKNACALAEVFGWSRSYMMILAGIRES
jgi:ribosome-binding protein aMBF1 (putative translation factor)